MKRKNKLIISSFMAVALGLGISGSAFAYQGDFSRNGPNYTPEFEHQITEVLTNKDYEGWKDLIKERVGNSKATEGITKDNFPRFIEAWKLAHEGKIKEANAIRRELGLSLHRRGPGNIHRMSGTNRMMNR